MGNKARHFKQLKANHRDLDEAIKAAEKLPGFPQATLKIMRRQKLEMQQKLKGMSHATASTTKLALEDVLAERVAEAGVCRHQSYIGPKGHSLEKAGYGADVIDLALRLGNAGFLSDGQERYPYDGGARPGGVHVEERTVAAG